MTTKLMASMHRNTRYEIRFLHQGPNAFGLECIERGVFGSAPVRLEVGEGLFTDEEMAQVHAALALLEAKFAIAHDAKEAELGVVGDAPRAMVHELVKAAEDAKKEAEEAKKAAKAAELERLQNEAATAELTARMNLLEQARREAQAAPAAETAVADTPKGKP